MRHGSLFSGIGGFDLAAEWMGWENVFHCEWNPFGQKILKHYWPNAKSYGDITKTDFSEWRGRIDIVSGGFPCQPYSTAGKRKGKADNRHLWPEMLRAIREIQPRWVVGENVRGLTNWNGGLVFDEVQADLENEGYEVTPFLLPACAINADHKRERIWFIAHSGYNGHIDGLGEGGRKEKEIKTESHRQERNEILWEWNRGNINGVAKARTSSNTNISRRKECGQKWKSPIQFTQDYRFTSQPGIYRGDDGFSERMDRIKGLGNAIVPQLAYEIFKAIELFNQGTKVA